MNDATISLKASLLSKRFRLRSEDDAASEFITCRVVGMKAKIDTLVLEIEGEDNYIFLTTAEFKARLVQPLD